MTLCPGCNRGVLERLTGELRAYLAIADETIRSVCSASCGTVGRFPPPLTEAGTQRPPVPPA